MSIQLNGKVGNRATTVNTVATRRSMNDTRGIPSSLASVK